MKLPFTKMHGAGNDFVVINALAAAFQPTPALLHRLTDRRFGVGCDQVLVVQQPSSAEVDFDYRIFNADGSEVGQCGNGTRALARFIREQNISSADVLRVATATARMTLRHQPDGQVQVDMGAPKLAAADVPLRMADALRYSLNIEGYPPFSFGAASMGNPHAVMVVEDVDTTPVHEWGALLQAQHEVFPEGVNVGFLQIVTATEAKLRVFERGSGETLACGSGACAAHVIARRWGLLAESAEIAMRGGTLTLHWAGEGQPVLMTGPAVTVFTGEIEWPA
jgi:diaminopimelate epimerase